MMISKNDPAHRVMRRHRVLGAGALLCTLVVGACAVPTATETPEPEDVGTVGSELVGTFGLGGQHLDVSEVSTTLASNTASIASCGDGVLYRAGYDLSLWVNTNGGVGTWTAVKGGAPGFKMACDHSHLYSLDAANHLSYARTAPNGQLYSTWSQAPDGIALGLPSSVTSLPPSLVQIQSGLGNLYLHVQSSTGSSLYVSALNDNLHPIRQGTAGSWTQLANNLGTKLVTGAGSTGLVTPENRAFGLNPDGTLYFNDTMLQGQNGWSAFPNAGLSLVSITADSASVLYATGHVGTGPLKLYKYLFTEENCGDGIDADRNGLVDGADPVCKQKLSTSYCASHTGNYCFSRIQPGIDGLVTCQGGVATLTAGPCTQGFIGSDYQQALTNPQPSGMGHYCNVIAPDNSWGFAYNDAFNSQPCYGLQQSMPGSKIVRAGVYATNGTNDVFVKCSDGGVLYTGAGSSPLANANSAVGHGKNACIVTASPRVLPVFNAPIAANSWAPNGVPGQTVRGYGVGHVFDHDQARPAGVTNYPCAGNDCVFDLSQFGSSGLATNIDNRGHATGYNDQDAYDFIITEGTPLRALANGKVIAGGSRARDITNIGAFGTARQNELWIRYDVGVDATYQESFLGYYAHLSQRLVESNQTVTAGQIIGYAGMTGQATDPHVHFGLVRVSNVNATTAGHPEYGYRVDLHSDPTTPHGINPSGLVGAIDPYGWRAASIDPWGYFFARSDTGFGSNGLGTWSPTVWSSTAETPPY